jgi:hypothetical protein
MPDQGTRTRLPERVQRVQRVQVDVERVDAAGVDDRRQKFHHPYTPYDIQLEFMTALYECLEERKIAIFESPTGTWSLVFSIS